MRYKQLQTEARTLVSKLMEIEDEKRENELVLESISKLEDDRKCWRLVNGVLMEKTKLEVVPEMRVVINNLN
jgi:prefoldin subunit 2